MATATIEHEDYSKRERILNALAVYPERYQMSNQVVAELTGASASYVYQLRAAIDAGDLSEEAVRRARDDRLQTEYGDRLAGLLEEADVPRVGVESLSIVEDAIQSQTGDGSAGSVPVEEVRRIRAVMDRYREDAAFERERFQGSGKNIAEEKYFVANRAVELLDDVIEG